MRGQIWYIDKGKNYMEHRGGKRPAIVVSNEKMNTATNRCMVVYLTTNESEHENKVPVMVKNTQSYAVCDNINTVFSDEMSCYTGTVDKETMKKIEEQMAKSLGLELKKDEPEAAGVTELQNEANFYKRAYEDLLAKMMAR